MADVHDHQILVRLLASRAYREGEFTLSSGRKSNFYLDAKQVTYDPEGIRLVGAAVYSLIAPYGVQAVGGLTMGADAIVAGVVFVSGERGTPIPGFIVRKEVKQHGLQKRIEGVFPPGARVAVVEDVLTSGGSALRAVDAVREAGGEVAVVVALVDRQEGGAAAIEREGIPFRAVTTITEIREAFHAEKR
jgi:orotate phosphoribosyltransferase